MVTPLIAVAILREKGPKQVKEKKGSKTVLTAFFDGKGGPPCCAWKNGALWGREQAEKLKETGEHRRSNREALSWRKAGEAQGAPENGAKCWAALAAMEGALPVKQEQRALQAS